MSNEPEVDVSALVREIEAEVARRRTAGDYPDELLRRLHAEFSVRNDLEPPEALAMIQTARPITSERRGGRMIVDAKRLLRRLMAWYVQPIARDQSTFNHAILRELRRLEERISRLEPDWSALDVEAERAAFLASALREAPAGGVLILGGDGRLESALNAAGVHALTEDEHQLQSPGARDPFTRLAAVGSGTLGAVVMPGVLPCLSARDLVEVMPMAARALRPGGLVVADCPDPDMPARPADASAVHPAMVRWVTRETASLLCEAAGMGTIRMLSNDARWYTMVAINGGGGGPPATG